MKKVLLVLGLVLWGSSALLSQDNSVRTFDIEEVNPRIDKPFGISLKAGGAWQFMAGLALDAFVIPELNVEFDFLPVDLLSSHKYYGGGIAVHPFGSWKGLEWSPYMGVYFGHVEGSAFLSGRYDRFNILNVPIGLSFMGLNRSLGFCLEIGAAWKRDLDDVPEGNRDEIFLSPGARLRLGF